MKLLLVKYKLVFRFTLVFLSVYVSNSLLYKFYLKYSEGSAYYPDYITNLVAEQSKDILTILGYKAEIFPNLSEPTLKFIINGNYVARIVEGCNAVSVIILFVSFVVAFSGKFKATLFYVLSGSVLIYVANLFRIALLSLWLYKYPGHTKFFHDIVFPLFIYGIVLVLWVFWVNKFSRLKNEQN